MLQFYIMFNIYKKLVLYLWNLENKIDWVLYWCRLSRLVWMFRRNNKCKSEWTIPSIREKQSTLYYWTHLRWLIDIWRQYKFQLWSILSRPSTLNLMVKFEAYLQTTTSINMVRTIYSYTHATLIFPLAYLPFNN